MVAVLVGVIGETIVAIGNCAKYVARLRLGLVLQRGDALQQAAGRLRRAHAGLPVQRAAARVAALDERLRAAWERGQGDRRHRLALVQRALDSVSPLTVLSRGYAVVTEESGAILRRSDQARVGQTVDVRLANGRFSARIIGTDD